MTLSHPVFAGGTKDRRVHCILFTSLKFIVTCFIFLCSFFLASYRSEKDYYKNKASNLFLFFLGCLAVAAYGDYGEISCSQCQAILKGFCEPQIPSNPEYCVAKNYYFCLIPCDGCQAIVENLCRRIPAASVDACFANGEQFCLENNGKGNGKGWGKGQGNGKGNGKSNGKGWGKGKGNDIAELSCLQCQALTKGFGRGKYICQVACNQCQEFTEYLCSLIPEDYDACIANVEPVCLENNGKGNGNGNGKGWGNGKQRFLY